MNIFRKNDSELLSKIEGYEVHITDLETQINNQAQQIQELVGQVQKLMENVQEKQEIVEVAETILEQTEKELEEVKEQLVERENVIEEVLENTVTVSKQAAIQAAVILGEMGTPVVETVDAPKEVDIISEIRKLKGQELIDFYNKHKPTYSGVFQTFQN